MQIYMIKVLSVLEATLYCFMLMISIVLSNVCINYSKILLPNYSSKERQIKLIIGIMTFFTLLMMIIVYLSHCWNAFSPLQCFYINPRQQLLKSIAFALFINTNLFLGGLHQQLYVFLLANQNGRIKKKFMRFYKKSFQWKLFKKLFVVPLCVEVVYRAIVCRVVDPNFEHPHFLTFLSAQLFSLSHLVNLFIFEPKYGFQFSIKAVMIQMGYNLIFGLYVAYIFTKSHYLISAIVIQVYANFMGYPQYFQILKGNFSNDRIKKSTIFYLCGFIGCLSCLLFI